MCSSNKTMTEAGISPENVLRTRELRAGTPAFWKPISYVSIIIACNNFVPILITSWNNAQDLENWLHSVVSVNQEADKGV